MEKRQIMAMAVGIAAALAPAAAHSDAPWPPGVQAAEMKDGTVVFSAPNGVTPPAPLKTGLTHAELLGMLRPRDEDRKLNIPYVLVSTMPCPDCPARKTLRLIRADGKVTNTFVYPGKVRDREDQRLLVENHAFFGRCVSRVPGDVYVVYSREQVGKRKGLQESVFLAEIGEDRLYEKVMVRGRPSLQQLESRARAKSGDCRKVAGLDRVSIPFELPKGKPEAETQADAKQPVTR